MNTLERIKEEKIIAIIRGVSPSQILSVANALYEGGISMMEITFDQSSPQGIEATTQSLELIHTQMKGKILMGAGTVMTPQQVETAHIHGAEYIISPNVDTAVIRHTKELGMISMPGAFTPSEVATAYEAGADIVKLFPAGLMGPDYIKALRAPLSHIPVSAVGGINEYNIADFWKAGVCCFGIGGNLVDKKAVLNGNWKAITETARKLVTALHEENSQKI